MVALLVFLQLPVVVPLPVESVEGGGDPAGAALDRHEREARVAVADAAEDQVGDALPILDEGAARGPGEVRLGPDLGAVVHAPRALDRRQPSGSGAA